MMNGSETWPVKKEGNESMLERTEMRMVMWMCGTSLREKKSSAELRDRMDLDATGCVLMRNRLRRFSQEERKDKDWMRKCMYIVVRRPSEWPNEAWLEVVKKDLKELGKGRYSGPSSPELVKSSPNAWNRTIVGVRAGPGLPGAPLGFFQK